MEKRNSKTCSPVRVYKLTQVELDEIHRKYGTPREMPENPDKDKEVYGYQDSHKHHGYYYNS